MQIHELGLIEGMHPPRFIVCERYGSAYYLHGDELVQVPLSGSGVPVFQEDVGEGNFGGGVVDFDRGVSDDDRAVLREIASDLRTGRGFINDDVYIEV